MLNQKIIHCRPVRNPGPAAGLCRFEGSSHRSDPDGGSDAFALRQAGGVGPVENIAAAGGVYRLHAEGGKMLHRPAPF